MLTVSNLHKRYGDLAALRGVSFTLEEGDILGFLGPNGAGKTTTMRIITGYLPASAGRVEVCGHDVDREPLEVRRRIGYLAEHTPLYSDMRVTEYLHHRAWLKGVPRRDRRRRVGAVMERTVLEERARQIIGNLSKGYRQRVGIADALVGDPSLLILDEPTIGLDPNQVRQLRALVQELAAERTVLLSTHILAEVEMICNKVVIAHEGRTVAADTLATLVGAHDRRAVTFTITDPGLEDRALLKPLRCSSPGLESIERLSAEPGERRYRATPKPGCEPRAALSSGIAEAGYELLELRPERASLEQVFTTLTTPTRGEEEA